MKIIILTDLPQKKYQNVSFDALKFYCEKNGYDLMFKDDYYYDYNYEYVVYISNNCLVLDVDVKMENYINGRNYIESYTDTLNFTNFLIFKNDENIISYIKDFKKIKEIHINKKINILSDITINNNLISNYKNKIFFKKHNNPFLFIYGEEELNNQYLKLNDVVLEYIYNQLISVIYFNKDYFDNLIDFNQYEYGKEIEIFNPNNKIAFVSMISYKTKDYNIQTEFNIKKYCEKNNYTYYIHRNNELYNKPLLLKKYIDKHEYIIWVDSDVLVFDMDFKIEDILNNKTSFYCFKDLNLFFSDNFLIFKNDNVSKNILDEWINKIEYNKLNNLVNEKYILIDIVNNFIKYIYRSTKMEINIPISYLNKNTKIINFYLFSDFLKIILMEYINYIVFNLKHKDLL